MASKNYKSSHIKYANITTEINKGVGISDGLKKHNRGNATRLK